MRRVTVCTTGHRLGKEKRELIFSFLDLDLVLVLDSGPNTHLICKHVRVVSKYYAYMYRQNGVLLFTGTPKWQVKQLRSTGLSDPKLLVEPLTC